MITVFKRTSDITFTLRHVTFFTVSTAETWHLRHLTPDTVIHTVESHVGLHVESPVRSHLCEVGYMYNTFIPKPILTHSNQFKSFNHLNPFKGTYGPPWTPPFAGACPCTIEVRSSGLRRRGLRTFGDGTCGWATAVTVLTVLTVLRVLRVVAVVAVVVLVA